MVVVKSIVMTCRLTPVSRRLSVKRHTPTASCLPVVTMAKLTRFLTRYYILNILVAATYFVVRRFYPRSSIHHKSEFLGITRVCVLRSVPHPHFCLVGHSLVSATGTRNCPDWMCSPGTTVHEDHHYR